MFWGLIGKLLGLGPSILDLGKRYFDLQQAKEKAKTDKEIAEINAEMAAVSDRRAVLVAEAGSRINAVIRGTLVAGIAVYAFKCSAWDKVVGGFAGCAGPYGQMHEYCGNLFRTDPLDAVNLLILTAALGYYFLTRK